MKKFNLLIVLAIGITFNLQAQIVLNNNEFLQAKKPDGSTTKLVGISSNNNVVLGSYGQAVDNLYFYNGASPIMRMSSNGSVSFNTTNQPGYPQLRFEGGGFYFYKENSDVYQHYYISYNNADIRLAYKGRGSGGRAIVHNANNELY